MSPGRPADSKIIFKAHLVDVEPPYKEEETKMDTKWLKKVLLIQTSKSFYVKYAKYRLNINLFSE